MSGTVRRKGNNLHRLGATSVAGCVLVVTLSWSVGLSNCFKTMSSVHQLASGVQPVSLNKVPLMWRPDSANKSFPTTVIVESSCSSSSSTGSSKCWKEKSEKKLRKSKGHKKHGAEKPSATALSEHGPPETPKSLLNLKQLTPESIADINKFMRRKRHYCKLHQFEGFTCQKFRFATWLVKQMEANTTKLSSWLEVVKTSEEKATNGTSSKTTTSSALDLSDAKPNVWPEQVVFRLLKAWGDPEDLFVFYKYKDFVKSREIQLKLPYQVQLKIAPKSESELELARASNSVGEARIFWDPGFNLKLKLPFFRDELKVAVSTGPSFIAGIGVGIALLIIKTMFAPFILGMKWMMYNVFFKDSGPFDLMKMFFHSHSPEPWDSSIPPPAIEHYHPPPGHSPYAHHPPGPGRRPGPPPPHFHHHPPYHMYGPPGPGGPYKGGPGPGPPGPGGYGGPMHASPTAAGPGPSSFDLDYHNQQHSPYDLKHQFTQSTPIVQTLAGVNPTMSQLEALYRHQLLEEGLGVKRPSYKSLLQPEPTNSIDVSGGMEGMGMEAGQDVENQDSQSYIPSTGLQAEVEHFDPFYSPLLSKIDAIFTHLGHNDEGCRERVVCSIYKFPVKYAPYSNLISAQLSKHQTELKRPVTSSTKILRYFRYMKAAKDGQGGESCLEQYPKCSSDTDSVSSLPMITTFNQLSELMTAESSSPGVALATAG